MPANLGSYVEQNLIGYAANIAKALSRHANQPSWPRCGMPDCAVDVSNQGWRQQEYLHLGIGDLNQALAKIDLKLLARRHLKPHCGSRLPCQRAPIWCHRPLDRAQADEKALLGDQTPGERRPRCRDGAQTSPAATSLLPITSVSARRLLLGP